MARSTRHLPDVYDPMVTEDGTVIRPVGAEAFKRTEVVSNTETQRIVSSTRRKLAELPSTGNQMNVLSVVLVYTVSGLSDDEIGVATGIKPDQLVRLRDSGPYKEIERYFIDAVKAEATNEVKAIMVQGEKNAAKKIVDLIDSEDHKIALAASKDLLDRGGHKAADKVDFTATMRNTFRIEVVDKRDLNGAQVVIEHEEGVE